MSQIPQWANHFWVSFTVGQLFFSVQLFKCQFYQATLMVIQVSCKGRLQFLKFRNWSIPRYLLLRSSLLHAVLNWRNPLHGDDKNQMMLALFRRWSSKNSNRPQNARRLFSKCMLTCGMYDGKKPKQNKKKKTLAKNLHVSVIVSSVAAFVPRLHAHSQSGNSLTFISWYPDPSSCKIVKTDL